MVAPPLSRALPVTARRLLILLASAGVVAAVVIGLSQTHTSNKAPRTAALSPAAIRRALAGSPPPLAQLHAQASQLIPSSKDDFRRRLAALRGHPVVVNKWAAWCGPCRYEFPFLQRTSVSFGRRVAFLGLDAGDNNGDARAFLRRFPVSYPSFEDPNIRIATALGAALAFPTTIFYDATGKRRFIHQGAYQHQAQLVDDIRRYALMQ
jgi:cytochrome c biogenesis protein CcmG, thiol:disulfide interchange protein DsbE